MSFALALLRMFETPQERKRREARELQLGLDIVSRAVERGDVLKWDEMKIKFQPRMIIDGASYAPFKAFDIEPKWEARLEHDTLIYHHKILPKGLAIDVAQGSKRGIARFTTDVVVPILLDSARREPLWMSYTPQEILTCRPGVRFATGKVVVGGLGLGWMFYRIAEKPSVKEVILVEKDHRLMDWYGDRMICELQARFPDKTFGYYVNDVFEMADQLGPEYKYAIDIWSSYGAASWNPQVRKLRENGFKVWAWGESAHRSDR